MLGGGLRSDVISLVLLHIDNSINPAFCAPIYMAFMQLDVH